MTFDFFNDPQTANRPAELSKIAQQIGGIYSGQHYLPLLGNLAKAFGYDESDVFESKNEHPLTGKISNFIGANYQGQNVAVFDQTYYLSNYEAGRSFGKGRTSFTQTFFLTQIKEAIFPLFCIQPVGTPENFTKNIDFPSHPHLSQKFILYSKNEAAVRQLFTPDILNFFDNNIAFTLFAGETYLLIYQRNVVVSPNQIIASLNFIVNLANLFLRRD